MNATDTASTLISPLPVNQPRRPLLSVMIPTCEPGSYLLAALKSVLSQDLGAHEMQIAVVDDASRSNVREFVEQVDKLGRVEFHRTDVNRGMGGNWNECVRLARGQIVHLLHQDDFVANGFYERLLPAFSRRADIGMAFCRHAFVDSQNRTTRLSHRERWFAGVLRNWLDRIATKQRLQCAAVLVRRDVYETLGPYRTDLCYALDWEMWVRIAARYCVWYEPRVLAHYRRHDENESSRLHNAGRIGLDVIKAIELIGAHLPEGKRDALLSAAYESFASKSLKRLKAQQAVIGDVASLLEPVKVAVPRVTQPASSARRLQMMLAQLDQHSH